MFTLVIFKIVGISLLIARRTVIVILVYSYWMLFIFLIFIWFYADDLDFEFELAIDLCFWALSNTECGSLDSNEFGLLSLSGSIYIIQTLRVNAIFKRQFFVDLVRINTHFSENLILIIMEKYCNCSIYLWNLQNYYLDTRNNEIRSSFSGNFVAISMILRNTAEACSFQTKRSFNK